MDPSGRAVSLFTVPCVCVLQVLARFCFLTGELLDTTNFDIDGRPLHKASFSRTLEQNGVKDGTYIRSITMWDKVRQQMGGWQIII